MQLKIFFSLLLLCVCSATPKRRVLEEDLSNEAHYVKDGDEHNPEYDHEAFLGKEGARAFEELTPDESKQRLGELFHKVDKNGDGFVDDQELQDWIKHTQNKYVYDDAKKQMKQNDFDKDGYVTMEEYKNSTYGFLEDNNENADQYKEMLARDERRFKRADKNKDDRLNDEEFIAFLHPENDNEMKSIVVEETLEDIDKNKDGFIDLDEYLGDLWPEQDREAGKEPEWVKTEKEQFANYRDKNKDGKMDLEEVSDWILPPDYDHVKSESAHLIGESDIDKDGKISKKEMVDKYDLFAGSQATDFGEALKYRHEDL